MPPIKYQDFAEAIRRRMALEPDEMPTRHWDYRPEVDGLLPNQTLPQPIDPITGDPIVSGNAELFANAKRRLTGFQVPKPDLQTATPAYYQNLRQSAQSKLPEFKNLLSRIGSRGADATQAVLNIEAVRRAEAARRMMNGPGFAGGSANDYQFMTKGVSANLSNLMRAIARVESGGNYGARNRSTGAMGKYQILPGNIAGAGGWDRAALGFDISTQQFMRNPAYQEKIAAYMLGRYLNKYGPAGAALAWYAGPGVANRRLRSGQGYRHSSGYVDRVLRYL